MPEPQCATGACPRLPLPESRSDPTPHCYWHASRQQKQAHADAARSAARVRQRGPELLAFVRQLVRMLDETTADAPLCIDPASLLADEARALSARGAGEEA